MDKNKKTYAEKNAERTTVILDFATILHEKGYKTDVSQYDIGEMKAITRFLKSLEA